MKGTIVSAGLLLLLLPLTLATQPQVRILVVYHSERGHTRQMAEAVARGAQSIEGATVQVRAVSEAKTEDILGSDAIIVGSPVYNANVAPRVQEFINQWPFEGGRLRDKVGAAFVAAGGISAGEELTQLNILHSMLVYGMVVAGGPDWTGSFGASAITEEEPFRKGLTPGEVPRYFLSKGEALGKRIAQLALKMKGK